MKSPLDRNEGHFKAFLSPLPLSLPPSPSSHPCFHEIKPRNASELGFFSPSEKWRLFFFFFFFDASFLRVSPSPSSSSSPSSSPDLTATQPRPRSERRRRRRKKKENGERKEERGGREGWRNSTQLSLSLPLFPTCELPKKKGGRRKVLKPGKNRQNLKE